MKKTFFLLFLAFFTQLIFGQDFRSISGVVTDADDGSPLAGVSVSVPGTTVGTVSDIDGKFTLNVPSGKSLMFSYIGYEQQVVAVKNETFLNVAMKVNVQMLDEVVAIGYGVVRKSDLTGAVGSISGEKLKALPVAKVDQALQGKLAGVTVTANSGQHGADAAIRVRGIGSLNGAAPIYVVDGIITNNINFLATSDIASLEVLKDASSAAIYGARGANGVILITTKKGNSSGKSNMTFESYLGTQNRWKKLNVMKRDEYAEIMSFFKGPDARKEYEAMVLGNGDLNAWIQSNYLGSSNQYYARAKSETDPDGFDYSSVDTDWQDEVFVKDATIQNYYFSIDGGSDKYSYLVSLNYFDQKGILIGSFYNRLSLRVNTSFQVRKWLKIGENLSYSNSHNRDIQGNGNTALISSALSMAPWDPVKYPEGTFSNYTRTRPKKDLSGLYSTPSLFKNVTNPFVQVYNGHPSNSNDDWVGDVYAEIYPIKGLTIRGDVNTKMWTGRNRNFIPILDVQYNPITKNSVSSGIKWNRSLTFEGTATYNTVIAKKHEITAMIGATAEETNSFDVSASGVDLANTDEKNWYVSMTPSQTIRTDAAGNMYTTRDGSDSVDKSRMASYFGRLNYSFNNRYLLTANVRVDGSYKFTPGYYWTTFPSVAGAWKISEESFFEKYLNIVDFLKIRAGWGRLGNDQSVGGKTFDLDTATGTAWMTGYGLGVPNINLSGIAITYWPMQGRWELTEQTDAGIDFSLFSNLLSGTVDIYRRDTKRMFMVVQPPGHVGYNLNYLLPTGNVATVRNDGVEFSLEHRKRIGKFSYSIGGNIAFVSNKLMKLNGGEVRWSGGGLLMSDEGYALNTIYTLVYEGVFQTQEEINNYTWTNPETGEIKIIQPEAKPGDAKYKDVNNDGQITLDMDRANAGNPFPTTTYGMNLTAEYNGFDLQVFFQGIGGNKVYNGTRQNKMESDGTSSILSKDMHNVWFRGYNEQGTIPNPYGHEFNKSASSRFVEDASYLRLKNLQFGYTLPASLTGKIGIEKLRLYIGGSNLLTFTKYKNFDPEVGIEGIDNGNFPQVRTLLFGLNMNF